MGNRISKRIEQHSIIGSIDQSNAEQEYYVRDAQGNVISIYRQNEQGNSMSIQQTETHIYGTQRLGIHYPYVEMVGNSGYTTDSTKYYYGYRQYELSNHLGNVLVTISDRKIPYDKDNDAVIDNFVADITSVSDYYPFGSPLYGRRWSAGYRYGFNGKENDNEIMGNGNFQDYGARMYDTRLGRFISADPIIVMQHKYQDLSPYQFAGLTPIRAIDLDGLEPAIVQTKFEKNGYITATYVPASDVLQRKLSDEEVKILTAKQSGSFKSSNEVPGPSIGNLMEGVKEFGERGEKLRVSTTPLKTTGKIKYYTNNWGGNPYIKTKHVFNKDLMKGIGKVGSVGGNVISGYEIWKGFEEDKYTFGPNTQKALAEFGAGWGGALGGAKLGAEIGTAIFPGPGTVIGGALGSVIGSWIAETAVEKAGEKIKENNHANTKKADSDAKAISKEKE